MAVVSFHLNGEMTGSLHEQNSYTVKDGVKQEAGDFDLDYVLTVKTKNSWVDVGVPDRIAKKIFQKHGN